MAEARTTLTRDRPSAAESPAERTVCHCRQVTYGTVRKAIDHGASSLSDLQHQTTACTRCFGCRFDLEQVLEARLGDAYSPTKIVTLPVREEPSRMSRVLRRLGVPRAPAGASAVLPRRMYMPVLEGFEGHDVRTRVILYNSYDDHDQRTGRRRNVTLRADLLGLDGSRLAATEVNVKARHSAVFDIAEMAPGGIPDGVGAIKLVVEAEQLGSFRPYFHFTSPGGITSTHEKAGTERSMASTKPRPYYWLLPVGYTLHPEHAYMFLTATQLHPLDRHELVWQDTEGRVERVPLPRLELDQSTCVPLHEHFPTVADGRHGGTVRIEPNLGIPAGFMIRYDPRTDLWRVQHL